MGDKKVRLYRCPICDTVVEMLDKVGLELACCGPAMVPLEPKTGHPGATTHLPIIRQTARSLTVVVSAKRHPMTENHYIEWIEVFSGGKCMRAFMEPFQEPEATFELQWGQREIEARAYCNVHGLWEASANLSIPAMLGAREGQPQSNQQGGLFASRIWAPASPFQLSPRAC